MKNNQSFTLVEVLTVMVIVGILSGFIITRLSDSDTAANLARGKAFDLSVLTALPANFFSEWKFDGPTTAESSATTDDVKDTWGPGDGTVNGGLLVKGGSSCVSGKCLFFDGTNDYVLINSSAYMFKTGNFTVGLWANATVLNSTYDGLITTDIAADAAWKIVRDTGNNYFTARYGTTTANYPIVSINTWHYYVYIKSGTSLILYLDGKLVSNTTCPATHAVNGTQLVMGSYRVNDAISGNHMFNGLMDDVRIFNDALPVSKINQIYLSGLDDLYLSNQISKEEYNQRSNELKYNLTKHE